MTTSIAAGRKAGGSAHDDSSLNTQTATESARQLGTGSSISNMDPLPQAGGSIDAESGRPLEDISTNESGRILLSQVELGSAQSVNGRETQQDRLVLAPFPSISRREAVQFLVSTADAINYATESTYGCGSTFTGAIVTGHGEIVTAHLGDSPASYVILDSQSDLVETALITMSHRPKERVDIVTASDGTRYADIGSYRCLVDSTDAIVQGIQLTHSFGDREFGAAIQREAEISLANVQRHLNSGHTVLLLITSDGAHEDDHPQLHHAAHAQSISVLLKQRRSLADMAAHIVHYSERFSTDNVSVALAEVRSGCGALVAVFDGHGTSADVAIQGATILGHRIRALCHVDMPNFTEFSKRS